MPDKEEIEEKILSNVAFHCVETQNVYGITGWEKMDETKWFFFPFITHIIPLWTRTQIFCSIKYLQDICLILFFFHTNHSQLLILYITSLQFNASWSIYFYFYFLTNFSFKNILTIFEPKKYNKRKIILKTMQKYYFLSFLLPQLLISFWLFFTKI